MDVSSFPPIAALLDAAYTLLMQLATLLVAIYGTKLCKAQRQVFVRPWR